MTASASSSDRQSRAQRHRQWGRVVEICDSDETDLSVALGGMANVRWRIRVSLTLALLAAYFGFMALFAFAKPLLGRLLAPGLTVCILLGPLVIVIGCVLSLIYVVWANTVYDPAMRRLVGSRSRRREG
jgi:uncharacterized membrane protein (DUF485 family)